MSPDRRRALIAAGLLLVGGLGGLLWMLRQGEAPSGASSSEVVSWDSAGVTIVDHSGARGTGPPEWRLSAEPIVRIGSVDGPGQGYLFSGVRHGTVLSSGEIAVSNARPAEVRIFDLNGRYMRRVGRPGEGPGEFASVQRLVEVAADTLAVQDHARRVNFFGVDGRLLSTLPGPFVPGMGGPNPSGLAGTHWVWIGEGRFLVVGNTSSTWGDASVRRFPVALTLWDREHADEPHLLGEFPGTQQFRANDGGPLSDLAIVIPSIGRRMLWEPGRDRVHVAETGSDEVLTFDMKGRLVRILRMNSASLPVLESDREAAIREERDARHNQFLVPPEYRGEFERILDELPLPQYHPFVTALKSTRAGDIWVRRPSHSDDSDHLWEVFDEEGILRGSVRIPAVLEVLEFGENHVLAVRTDELDVEFVELYGLER